MLAAPRGGSLAVGGTRLPYGVWAGGFTAVATGQGPCVPGADHAPPSVEVLDRPGVGTAVAAALEGLLGGVRSMADRGWGLGLRSPSTLRGTMFISPLAPDVLVSPS